MKSKTLPILETTPPDWSQHAGAQLTCPIEPDHLKEIGEQAIQVYLAYDKNAPNFAPEKAVKKLRGLVHAAIERGAGIRRQWIATAKRRQQKRRLEKELTRIAREERKKKGGKK